MLIRNQNEVINILKLDLYFENNVEKHFTISEDDIVAIVYNKNGLQTSITGKVIDIDSKAKNITIDGSALYTNNTAKFSFDHILDCDMISNSIVEIPSAYNGVTMRVSTDGILQYSTDGIVWVDVIRNESTKTTPSDI